MNIRITTEKHLIKYNTTFTVTLPPLQTIAEQVSHICYRGRGYEVHWWDTNPRGILTYFQLTKLFSVILFQTHKFLFTTVNILPNYLIAVSFLTPLSHFPPVIASSKSFFHSCLWRLMFICFHILASYDEHLMYLTFYFIDKVLAWLSDLHPIS